MNTGLPLWMHPLTWGLRIIGLPIALTHKLVGRIEDKLGDWIG